MDLKKLRKDPEYFALLKPKHFGKMIEKLNLPTWGDQVGHSFVMSYCCSFKKGRFSITD